MFAPECVILFIILRYLHYNVSPICGIRNNAYLCTRWTDDSSWSLSDM